MTIITAHQRAKRPHTRDHQLEAESVTIKKVRLAQVILLGSGQVRVSQLNLNQVRVG